WPAESAPRAAAAWRRCRRCGLGFQRDLSRCHSARARATATHMRRVGALAATALLTGCPESCLIQRTRPLSTEPPAVLKPATPQAPIESAAPPAPQHPGKGTFGESIEFLGYDTEP